MEEMFGGECGGGGQELNPFPEPHPQPQHQEFFYPQLIAPVAVAPQKLRPIRSNGRNDALGFQEDAQAPMQLNFSSHPWFSVSPLNCSASSSSDCSHDSAPNPECPNKRRKKNKKKMESFLQDLVSQVIQKQEQMHQQLMELFQNNEHQRILREEAWRKQEMERAKRDHQIRAQEAARSLAFISFIRNALGVPEIQIPQLLLPEEEIDPNNKRWPTSEVEALITLRAALNHKFHNLANKPPVWEQVSAGMASMGFIRSPKKCKEKWENLNKYYRKATGKKFSDNAKTCPYFHQLETLYKNRLITAPTTD